MEHAHRCLKDVLKSLKITKVVLHALLDTFYKEEFVIKNIQTVSFITKLQDNVDNALKITFYQMVFVTNFHLIVFQ